MLKKDTKNPIVIFDKRDLMLYNIKACEFCAFNARQGKAGFILFAPLAQLDRASVYGTEG